MLKLFHELKRRNVFRAAALYLAATWLILQVADIVLDAFDAPSSIMRLLIFAFIAVFPAFIALSWFYEFRGARLVKDTGESGQSARGWTTRGGNIAIAGLVILGAGIFVLSQTNAPRDTEVVETGLSTIDDAEPSIAVLPLDNISSDPADAYFADGLTEELLNVLTSVAQLRVTARATSFALRETDLDARAIGEQLGVSHIIEGSVRKDGDRLRVSVQFVDALSGTAVWSATYDRALTDIFEIQKDIAERVSGTLQLSLFSDPNPIIRRTRPDAYTAYLRALALYRNPSGENYAAAVVELEKAISLDDQYAPAWSLLSSVRQNQAITGAVDYAAGHEMARQATERALAIDPNYAYAISTRAWLAMTFERDFRLAAQAYRRALELAPNDPVIIGNLAVLERWLGRIDRAIRLTNQSVSQNPLSASAYNNLSDQLYQAGRYRDAIESASRALQLAPESTGATVNLAISQILAEEPGAALTSIASLDVPFYVFFIEALARFDLGERQAADAALASLAEDYPDQRAAYIAAIYAYRGEKDRAFAWLQRAVEERQRILSMRTEPLYENLREDVRWQRILEQVGLSDQQVAQFEN